jgi:hypothetical protein
LSGGYQPFVKAQEEDRLARRFAEEQCGSELNGVSRSERVPSGQLDGQATHNL